MKSLIPLFIITFLFVADISVLAQDAQTTRVRLNVNTADITRRTVNENANFGQNQEQVSNEDYTVRVRIGDTVIWNGISTSSEDDVVEIVSINHEGGVRLFDANVLNGSDGVVIGTIATSDENKEGNNKRISRGDTEKYTIKFRIIRDGRRVPGIFQIDPKLVIRQ